VSPPAAKALPIRLTTILLIEHPTPDALSSASERIETGSGSILIMRYAPW